MKSQFIVEKALKITNLIEAGDEGCIKTKIRFAQNIFHQNFTVFTDFSTAFFYFLPFGNNNGERRELYDNICSWAATLCFGRGGVQINSLTML